MTKLLLLLTLVAFASRNTSGPCCGVLQCNCNVQTCTCTCAGCWCGDRD